MQHNILWLFSFLVLFTFNINAQQCGSQLCPPTDSCCEIHTGEFQCYKLSIYVCFNTQNICKLGDLLCNNECYNKNTHECFNSNGTQLLCERGLQACGSICYDPLRNSYVTVRCKFKFLKAVVTVPLWKLQKVSAEEHLVQTINVAAEQLMPLIIPVNSASTLSLKYAALKDTVSAFPLPLAWYAKPMNSAVLLDRMLPVILHQIVSAAPEARQEVVEQSYVL